MRSGVAVNERSRSGRPAPLGLGEAGLGDDVLEIEPGPGLTTDVLRARVPRLTAVEADTGLAGLLARRLAGSNVEVVHADASALPFPGRMAVAPGACQSSTIPVR